MIFLPVSHLVCAKTLSMALVRATGADVYISGLAAFTFIVFFVNTNRRQLRENYSGEMGG